MITKKQFAQEDCPADIKAQLIRLMRQEWPGAFDDDNDENVEWPDNPDTHPISLVHLDGTTVVSHVAIPNKEIQHEGNTYRAYGISEVMTNPLYRRQGHGVKLMHEAAAYIEAQQPDLSVFTCNPGLISFYEQGGWTHIPGAHLIGGTRMKPFRSDTLELVTMLRLFSARAKAHQLSFTTGDIVVELGEQKLW